LVDLSPEAVFEDLLGLLEALVVLEAVQVSQHPHHLGEAMHLNSALQADTPSTHLQFSRQDWHLLQRFAKLCFLGTKDLACQLKHDTIDQSCLQTGRHYLRLGKAEL